MKYLEYPENSGCRNYIKNDYRKNSRRTSHHEYLPLYTAPKYQRSRKRAYNHRGKRAKRPPGAQDAYGKRKRDKKKQFNARYGLPINENCSCDGKKEHLCGVEEKGCRKKRNQYDVGCPPQPPSDLKLQ